MSQLASKWKGKDGTGFNNTLGLILLEIRMRKVAKMQFCTNGTQVMCLLWSTGINYIKINKAYPTAKFTMIQLTEQILHEYAVLSINQDAEKKKALDLWYLY